MKGRVLSYLTALSALILGGCEFRALDYDYIDTAEVNIIADWSLSGLTVHPNGHTVMFFPQDGGGPTLRLSHGDTVSANLPLGMYDVIVFNETFDDFDCIEFTGRNSFNDIAAVCSRSELVRSGYRVFEEPDLLASAVINDFEVTEGMVNETRAITRARTAARKAGTRADAGGQLSRQLTWTVRPTPLVHTVRVRVAVHGLDRVSSTGAYISGFSQGVYLATGIPMDAAVTHKLTFTGRHFDDGSATRGWLDGSFHSFGLAGSGESDTADCGIDFRAVLPDGSTFQDIRSLKGRIRENQTEFKVSFEIDVGFDDSHQDGPVVIPDVEPPDPPDSGGWQVQVGDWDEEVIPISM